MMWESVSAVSGPLSLIAFVIAALVTIYRIKSKRKIDEIAKLPEKERAKVIARDTEFFDVNLENVPAKDKVRIALEQLRNRAARERTYALLAALFGLLLAAFAISGVYMTHTNKQLPKNITEPDVVSNEAQSDLTSYDTALVEPASVKNASSVTDQTLARTNDVEIDSNSPITRPERKGPQPTAYNDSADVHQAEPTVIPEPTIKKRPKFRIKDGVNDGYMNVRSNASPKARILFRLYIGEVFDSGDCVTGKGARLGWCQVFRDGNVGWVAKSGIEPFE